MRSCCVQTMCARAVFAGVLLLSAALAAGKPTIETLRLLSFEKTQELTVNSTVEYLLQFVPDDEQGLWPSRLRVNVSGGDTARPLLVTARRRTGALTWQLPYYSGGVLLYEMERAQCPEDSVVTEALDAACGDNSTVHGEISLHVSTSCAASVTVWLLVTPEREWVLPFAAPAAVHALLGAPPVRYYRFPEGQDSVRLVVESGDDACATVAVQNYTCPIAETLHDIETSALRMTVQRSGGAQLSRSAYPRGFYVITVLHETDVACRGDVPADRDWLWEEAVLPAAAPAAAAPAAAAPAAAAPAAARAGRQSDKRLTLTVRASLSRTQYAVGVGVTLALFLLFYVGFGLLVLAQRLPRWARLVGPRAVLAPKPEETGTSEEQAISSASPTRRRRDSTATFDSSDNSDTDDEEEGTGTVTTAATPATTPATTPAGPHSPAADNGPAGNGIFIVDANTGQLSETQPERASDAAGEAGAGGGPGAGARPFGLPARLNVADMARRRERVLHARSDRYLYTLYTVALFYTLPVVQFVAAFQLVLNVSGSLDICYYNFLCAHPAGALSDFNHVFSNAGYLLLGALFMLQEYGIPAHYGLLSSLGASMMMVALLSATYHICPNALNFQFDTAFMYVMAVLSMVKIYQSRHPDINARAHATFGVLAVLIALVVWGVLAGGPLFWSLFTVLHVFTVLMLSLSIYYVGQFRFEKESLAVAARGLRSRPLYTPRLVMLLIANTVNWAFALYGLFNQSADFASHLLNVLLFNTLLYMVFYISMKLLHGERLRWYAWAFLAAGAASWAPAMYFFLAGSTSWATTPALSRHRNHECRVLQFYDSHDLWHMLSAVALYFSFNAMLTWDDGLAAVKRTEIAVF